MIEEDVFHPPVVDPGEPGEGGGPPDWDDMPALTAPCDAAWLDRQCQTIYGLRALDDILARRVFNGGVAASGGVARGGGAHFYATDPQGSPLAILNCSIPGFGQVTERVEFDSYGVPRHTWPAVHDNREWIDNDTLGDYINGYFGTPGATTATTGYSLHIDYDGDGTYTPDDLGN